MLYSIIYISEAAVPLGTDELGLLLEQARTNNLRDDITGMLLYIQRHTTQPGGRFMQVLEGEKEVLQSVYAKIKVDERHKNVILVSGETIRHRSFTSWSMGFKMLEAKDFTMIPGYINICDSKVLLRKLSGVSKPINYLKSFYQMNQQLNFNTSH